jgi:hypothetical protein
MAYYNREVEYPLNLIAQLGEIHWDVDLKLVEENFENILNDYFQQPNCFLNEREQTILLARYKEKRTLEEIGKDFNITRERARQIEKKAINKLKYMKGMFINSFDEYLELKEYHVSKRKELCDKIAELDSLLDKAGCLLANESTTIKEIKEFLKLTTDQRQDVIIRNSDISELDLSVRSYNCLRRTRINTIKELCELTHEDLMKIRNLGRKSQKEIIEKLRELGIELREE